MKRRADFHSASTDPWICVCPARGRAQPTSLRAPVSANSPPSSASWEKKSALAEIVSAVMPSRDRAIHPATRTFQALRIFVNGELSELALGLAAAERVLKASGRLVVVAFHSLEDRI